MEQLMQQNISRIQKSVFSFVSLLKPVAEPPQLCLPWQDTAPARKVRYHRCIHFSLPCLSQWTDCSCIIVWLRARGVTARLGEGAFDILFMKSSLSAPGLTQTVS